MRDAIPCPDCGTYIFPQGMAAHRRRHGKAASTQAAPADDFWAQFRARRAALEARQTEDV